MSNYPLGANESFNAPWKEREHESKEVDVIVNVTLIKQTTVRTDEYNWVEDVDGERCLLEFTKDDFTKEYKEQKMSLKEVLDGIVLAKEEVEKGLWGTALIRLKSLAEAAKGWELEDVYCEKEE